MSRNESFVLTISPNLFRNWTWMNGVSEIVQNAIDEHRTSENSYSIEHDPKTETLRVANEFARLEKDALISGFSTKTGIDTIGKFGIGLPASLSVLADKNFKVEVFTNTEIWRPEIIEDPNFNMAKLTKINVRKRRAGREIDFNGVEVFISPISVSQWEKVKPRFLFLNYPENHIQTYYGNMLLDENQKGKIYTKGIYVGDVANLSYGYDLNFINTDMERKLPDYWTLKYEIGKVQREAFLKDRSKIEKTLFQNLFNNGSETEEFIPSRYDSDFPKIQEIIVTEFKKQHGENTIPVANTSESFELQTDNKIGVVVPTSLLAVLQPVCGSIDTFRKEKKNSWTKIYNAQDLNDTEKDNFRKSIEIVKNVLGLQFEFHVVDFNDENMGGLFSNGDIYVARKTLSNLFHTESEMGVCSVLIHEYAHNFGDDATRNHTFKIEQLYSKICNYLYTGRN